MTAGDMQAAAEWCFRTLVNRHDAHGAYGADGAAFTAKDEVTIELLERHFGGEISVGLHAVSLDGTCLWGVLDLDAHDGGKEELEQVARDICERLAELGAEPLLEDSGGGFHVWIFFSWPVKASAVRALLRGVAPPGAEVFPKQDAVRDGGFGSWVRLPGKHPRRGTWSRFWDAAGHGWIEWPDGLALFAGSGRCPEYVLEEVAEPDLEHGGEKERASGPVPPEIREGGRNQALTSLAGTLRRRGLTRQEIEGCLRFLNMTRCRPPLPDDEVREIAASVARYEPEDALGDPGFQPPQPDEGREALLGRISQALSAGGRTIRIVRVIRRGASGSQFDLDLDGGRLVPIGAAAHICSFSRVRGALADAGFVLSAKLKPGWDPIAQALLDVAETVESETEADETRGWIELALVRKPPVVVLSAEDLGSVAPGHDPLFRIDERLFVRLEQLIRFLKLGSIASPTHKETAIRLGRIGFERARPSKGNGPDRVQVRAYLAPEGW